MAAKMPSCIRAIARMLGTKNETLLSRLVWSDSAATVSSGVVPESWRFAAITRPVAICWTACDVRRAARVGDHRDGDRRRRASPACAGRDRVGEALRDDEDAVEVARPSSAFIDSSSVPSVSSTGALSAKAWRSVAAGGAAVLVDPAEP